MASTSPNTGLQNQEPTLLRVGKIGNLHVGGSSIPHWQLRCERRYAECAAPAAEKCQLTMSSCLFDQFEWGTHAYRTPEKQGHPAAGYKAAGHRPHAVHKVYVHETVVVT
eukprot:TRINITY_DN39891_c0_g1_i2.p2 TRINITY_DN39891_c0_g1~~TRINITY_DN39891_c0_g1_i2.p2  ORF type:complete len:110 (+),score=0.90 TRINITY_DN39891_c0_g1_i2:103-432(+)